MHIVNGISLGIGCIGVIVIIWGSLISAVELFIAELNRFKGRNPCRKLSHTRHHYGLYLMMGLEYMIGADIVRTLIRPTLQELAVLGALVAIRTVTSYFLNKEMSQNHSEDH